MNGHRLKQARKKRNLTLDELAHDYNELFNGGLNKGTLSKYENGKQEPLAPVVARLATILGVDLWWLMSDDELDTSVRKADAFIEYLKSIGYSYDERNDICEIPVALLPEDFQKDLRGTDKVQGDTFTMILSKGDIKIEMQDNEFEAFRENLQIIVDKFMQLNEHGQTKVFDILSDLTSIDRYTKYRTNHQ